MRCPRIITVFGIFFHFCCNFCAALSRPALSLDFRLLPVQKTNSYPSTFLCEPFPLRFASLCATKFTERQTEKKKTNVRSRTQPRSDRQF